MSIFIKAELALNHTIIYTDDTGRFFRYSGGTWAWRNHNPGNLFPGNVSARHKQIGSTGKFAIFPDYESGHLALIDCLQTTYKNSSIDDLVKYYAPEKDGNNVKKYRMFLHDETGVNDDKKVKDFTADEFEKLWKAIEKMEGYKEGDIVEVFPVTQRHRKNHGIYNFNIRNFGWVTKSECLRLVTQNKLDLIICSHLGNDYLRARPGSSVNGSLGSMVVKDKHEDE